MIGGVYGLQVMRKRLGRPDCTNIPQSFRTENSGTN